MSEWCKNELIISGDLDQLDCFRKQAKGKVSVDGELVDTALSFERFIERPVDCVTQVLHWRIDNWGTESDVVWDDCSKKDDVMILRGLTLDTPPLKFVEGVARSFQKLTFWLGYEFMIHDDTQENEEQQTGCEKLEK